MVQPVENSKALRILLIDDELSFCEAVEDILRLESVDLYTLQDPSQAVSHAQTFKPHLILLDVYFGSITGLSVLKQLKNTDDLKAIPVIMLTSSSQKEHIESSQALGAVDYLVKPFRVPYFYQKLNQYLPHPLTLESLPPSAVTPLYLIEPDPSLRQFLMTLLTHEGYRVRSTDQFDSARALKTPPTAALFNPHQTHGKAYAEYCTTHDITQIHYTFDLTVLPIPDNTLKVFLNEVKQSYQPNTQSPCQK